ncbi:MAG: DUF3800 domain-containing protein [Lachnospiraceae bacterium]|nr:DUF3800 domain-containing protein [Lachnospiraceae bacterium]
MKQLSIFVDESGDFGKYEKHAPYYVIAMVFHDQESDIAKNIDKLDQELADLGYQDKVVHTEPLIRREEDYKNMPPNERRRIFTKLYFFFIRCDVKYKTFRFYKKEYNDFFQFEAKIAREISLFIRENYSYFQKYERVILYYDNGQHELNRILNTVLAAELSGYEIRKVLPKNYRLFQAADLVCTLELLRAKIETGELTRSEQLIFHSVKDLKKDFLKGIHQKSF